MIVSKFSTPFLRYTVSESLADMVESYVLPKLDLLNYNQSQYTDFHNNDDKVIYDLNEIPEFNEEVKKALNLFVIKTGFNQITSNTTTSVWCQDYKEGDVHELHHHGRAYISGIYWVRANENAGKIRFNNPNHMVDLWDTSGDTPYSTTYEDFESKRGVIMMWPSYLYHEVLPGGTNCKRTTIAFNFI